MISNSFKTLCAIALTLGVAACGGGETSSQLSAPQAPEQTPIASRYAALTAPAESSVRTLAGTSIATKTTTGVQTVLRETGTLDTQTQALTVENTQYSFASSANTFSTTGLILDGNGGSVQGVSSLGTGYSYLFVYNSNYESNGLMYDGLGVLGVVTNAEDMPTAGSADYVGHTSLVVNTQNGLTQIFSDGSTALTADFDTSQASMVAGNFHITGPTGAVEVGPFDTLRVDQMAINDVSLTGGNLTFLLGNTAVNVTGDNSTAQVEGTFFGHTSFVPAEVGGVIHATGDTGEISGVFVAQSQ